MAYKLLFVDTEGNLIGATDAIPDPTRNYDTPPYLPSVGDMVCLVQGGIMFSPGERTCGVVTRRTINYGPGDEQTAIVAVDISGGVPS